MYLYCSLVIFRPRLCTVLYLFSCWSPPGRPPLVECLKKPLFDEPGRPAAAQTKHPDLNLFGPEPIPMLT